MYNLCEEGGLQCLVVIIMICSLISLSYTVRPRILPVQKFVCQQMSVQFHLSMHLVYTVLTMDTSLVLLYDCSILVFYFM